MSLLVRMSSKGQLVIPRAVRRKLKLSPGAQLHLEIVDNRIVLEPVNGISAIDELYGMFADYDLLGSLEEERRAEAERDRALRS